MAYSNFTCRDTKEAVVQGNNKGLQKPEYTQGRKGRFLTTRVSREKNKGLVANLKRYGVIRSPKVAEVMENIDRGFFVPDGNAAYADSPMPIGFNAIISAPHMHATCLELLTDNLLPGMRALDIGSGSGYLVACFANMVGPQGRAVGVHHIPELVSASIENIQKSAASPLLELGSLSVHVGVGLGRPMSSTFLMVHKARAPPLRYYGSRSYKYVPPLNVFIRNIKLVLSKNFSIFSLKNA
ncbi:hypothetical protein MKX03_019347 [Papaver bracteatum]|nr:hypothetical protein MKX03_019347 [Papaver bracteatum]